MYPERERESRAISSATLSAHLARETDQTALLPRKNNLPSFSSPYITTYGTARNLLLRPKQLSAAKEKFKVREIEIAWSSGYAENNRASFVIRAQSVAGTTHLKRNLIFRGKCSRDTLACLFPGSQVQFKVTACAVFFFFHGDCCKRVSR